MIEFINNTAYNGENQLAEFIVKSFLGPRLFINNLLYQFFVFNDSIFKGFYKYSSSQNKKGWKLIKKV